MAEQAMVKEVKAEKKAFMAKPYSRDEQIKKDEEELENLKKQQKGEIEKEETKEEVEPETAEERSFKKRYGDLRRHSQKQTEELKKELDSLKKQLESSTKKEIKLPKTEEELETWAKEYPDVAAIVESIAIKKAKEEAKNLEDRMKEFEEMRTEATKEKAEAELLKLHPDFTDIREDDEFHQWADEQPKWVQDALYENKADKNIQTKKKSTDKDATKIINTRSEKSKPTTNEKSTYLKESQVQKMSTQEYEKRSDEIMEAIRSGQFIYDISGSAR